MMVPGLNIENKLSSSRYFQNYKKAHTFTQTCVNKQGFPQAKRVKILRIHFKVSIFVFYENDRTGLT